jgi:CRISPR/Cas system-associated endoribonuclease Cas2
MKKIIVTAMALVMASTVPGLAQTYRTEAREYRQENRIVRGYYHGELTPHELRKLKRQQHRIDRAQRRAARDGYVTRAERRKLERMQDRASRNIYRKTHNGRYVY